MPTGHARYGLPGGVGFRRSVAMDDAITANPIRVMVVDDHPMLRDGVVGSIRRQPDMVVAAEAGDGAAAIAAIAAARPNVVLMDLQMPGIDGVEAIQTI